MPFTIEVEQEDNGCWFAAALEIPGASAYGETREQAVRRVQVLSLRSLAAQLEQGECVPQITPVFGAIREAPPEPGQDREMNLAANPTVRQLRRLLAPCNDRAGNHLLWVTDKGEVRITCLARDQSAVGFEKDHPDMRLRCETFLAGNGYVGLRAAANREWLAELLDLLVNTWQKAKGSSEVAFLGPF